MICQPWPAFFQLPVLMLMLITLLNDGALTSVGYDIVKPSATPEHWNLSAFLWWPQSWRQWPWAPRSYC